MTNFELATFGGGCFWCVEAVFERLEGVQSVVAGYAGGTTLNRQGADVGTQYRSVIFYHDEQQKLIAEQSKQEAQKNFTQAIVTEIHPLTKFYPAENYHQDYYRNNPQAPYCQFIIKPKLKKLEWKL